MLMLSFNKEFIVRFLDLFFFFHVKCLKMQNFRILYFVPLKPEFFETLSLSGKSVSLSSDWVVLCIINAPAFVADTEFDSVLYVSL